MDSDSPQDPEEPRVQKIVWSEDGKQPVASDDPDDPLRWALMVEGSGARMVTERIGPFVRIEQYEMLHRMFHGLVEQTFGVQKPVNLAMRRSSIPRTIQVEDHRCVYVLGTTSLEIPDAAWMGQRCVICGAPAVDGDELTPVLATA